MTGSTPRQREARRRMADPWQRMDIAGKTADVFAPARPPRFGVLCLHDLDGKTPAGDPVFTRLLTEQNLACVCPPGNHAWWGDRICTEFDPVLAPERYLLDRVVPFFAER